MCALKYIWTERHEISAAERRRRQGSMTKCNLKSDFCKVYVLLLYMQFHLETYS